jgi:peptide/nickel transport system permease protein
MTGDLAPSAGLEGEFTDMPRQSAFRHVARVFWHRKLALLGLVVILVALMSAAFAPWLAPHDPYRLDPKQALLAPSSQHLMGTDSVGRDTFSRVIYGTRASIIVALVSVGISMTAGMLLGLIAGYLGGWVNVVIMRFVDTLMSIPGVILALTIATLLGGGLKAVITAIAIGMMSMYARMMWGQVMTAKQSDYVLAERAQGASQLRIMFRHILPNCFPILIVTVTIQLGGAILMEAGLSFLGVGIRPPTAAWGSMIQDGYKYLTTHPVLSIGPGVAIMLLVFAFNMVGDGLRDALDPRLRGTI